MVHPSFTLAEIAVEVGEPRRTVSSALDELEELGRVQRQDDGTWAATPLAHENGLEILAEPRQIRLIPT
jgi:DNA-binding IclR family transcriptional regulator